MATVDLGVVDGRRKRKTIYGATRKEAAIKLQEALAAKRDGSLVVGTVTVGKWMRHWLDVVCVERGLKPNTMKSHRSKVERYIIPNIGHVRLDKLDADDIRSMYANMARAGLSQNTRSQTHAILRRALVVAVRERKAPYNAADLLDRPSQVKVKREALSLADAAKVLAAAGDDPRWFLALYLGLRQGEALALRWSDVDLEAGLLRVERSLSIDGGRAVFVTPKTLLSQAPLPLPTVVASRLAVHRAREVAAGASEDSLVFHRDGQPIHPRADWQAWSDLLDAAGVKHVPLHAARNTTTTLLKSLGVSIEDRRAIMRHATIDMTDHYEGDDLGRKRTTLAALESALSGGQLIDGQVDVVEDVGQDT